MVVRFEFMWVTIPMLLIPLMYVLLQMIIIRIWMVSCPKRERERPNYSLHVMKEERTKPEKIRIQPQMPVIQPRRQAYGSSYQVANAPHVYRSGRSTPGGMSMGGSGWGTPMQRMTPSHQFQQFQSGRSTPQYGRVPQQY